MDKFFETSSDRRRAPRTKLAEIAYLGIGPENGGIVLDVSDGGLSFHAVSPVQPAESIRFLLSLRGHSRIEGSGEIVWTDDMKTVCGLKFTSLSAGAREHLDNWTNKTRMAAASEKALDPDPEAESPEFVENNWDADAEPVFAIPPADKQPSSDSETETLWQNPVFYWAMSGLLAAVLALASFLFGVHVGKSAPPTVAQTAPKPASPASPPVVQRSPVPAALVAGNAPHVPAGAPTAPKAATSTPAAATPGPGVALANSSRINDKTASKLLPPGVEKRGSALSDHQGKQASEAGNSDLTAAMAALNGDNGKRDTPRAVQLLWAAVASGNAKAALTLADLYIYGDGVTKNCDQGRILLKAATEHGSTEAKMKLDDLNANGCP